MIKKMFAIISGKFRNLKERQEKKVTLDWFSENPKIKNLDYVKQKDKVKVF
jgi:hypothetical protein